MEQLETSLSLGIMILITFPFIVHEAVQEVMVHQLNKEQPHMSHKSLEGTILAVRTRKQIKNRVLLHPTLREHLYNSSTHKHNYGKNNNLSHNKSRFHNSRIPILRQLQRISSVISRKHL